MPAARKPTGKTSQVRKPAPKQSQTRLGQPGVANFASTNLTPTNLAPRLTITNYRGAVPVKPFIGWLLVVLLAVLLGGLLAAQLLVNQRLGQLVNDTSARVALQGQNRASTVAAWLNGLVQVADTTAETDLVRLWLADREGALRDRALVQVVRAQTPYVAQLLADFQQRRGFLSAHLLQRNGQIVLGAGPLPANLAAAQVALRSVISTAKGVVLPVRVSQEAGPVLDLLRPILAQQDNAAVGTPAVVGVLWATVPVGARLAELVAATPLDRVGERTALLQAVTVGEEAATQLIGRTSVGAVSISLPNLKSQAAEAKLAMPSIIDGAPVFAAVEPIEGTPLALLQEYRAREALALMALYKPGLYAVVGLLTLMLGALMLALTLHLMGQRNSTRVRLLGQTMDALVRVVEARDPYLAGHHQKVARLALALGNALRLSVGERATLYYAAQLAAVGRLLVPREMMGKKSPYTAAERAELQRHITQATEILGALEFDLPIVPVIGQLYERVDGSGYPRGLLGHQLHRMAKVLGAADAYVAMTADRAHRQALSKTEALRQMAHGAFDADVLAALRNVAK
jgi:HD-GYP domain-containing protein (c-di-GMP phosphodiesterase class II)